MPSWFKKFALLKGRPSKTRHNFMKEALLYLASLLIYFGLAVITIFVSMSDQPTVSNFNGRLSNIGLLVNCNCDLRFNIYGSQAESDLHNEIIPPPKIKL